MSKVKYRHPDESYLDLQQIIFLLSFTLANAGFLPNRRTALALRAMVHGCEHGTFHADDPATGKEGYLQLPNGMTTGQVIDLVEEQQKLELEPNVTV